MNRSNLHDESGKRTGNPQSRPSKSSERRADQRQPSERLPSRPGRRGDARPPVDPDLERFLTSSGMPIGMSDGPASAGSSDSEQSGTAPSEPARRPHPAWPDLQTDSDRGMDSSEDDIEVIIPEEVEEYSLPKWKRIDQARPDRAARPPRTDSASTHQLVHVPHPEPLFPGVAPGADRDATDNEKAVRVLFRRFPLFLLVAIVIWSVFAVYLNVVPPTYQSETTLLIDIDAFESDLDDLPRLNAAGAGFGSGKLANQVLILQSSPEMSQSVATELARLRADSPGIADWTIFDRLNEYSKQGGSLATLLTDEYITVQGRSSDEDEPDAITISATSTDPAEASLIANTFGQTYVREVDRLVNTHFADALGYYRDRREGQQARVDELSEDLKTFIRQEGGFASEADADHILQQIASLNASLDGTAIDIEELKASITSLEEEVNLMDGQLVAERAAHGIEDQLDQSYERIAELNIEIEKYYVKNPELRQDPSPSKSLTDLVGERNMLRTQVDSLSQMYSDEITAVGGVDLRSYDGGISYMASLRRDLIKNRVLLNAAEAKQQATLVRLADYERKRQILPERAIEYRELSTRHESAVNEIDDLDEKIRTVEEASDGRRAFVRILNPAVEASSPKVPPLMIGILGGLLGLLAGIGAAFTAEKTDRRLYEKSDIEQYDADVIASIPRFRGVSRKSKRVFYERRISTEMITILHPESPVSRSLRSIPLRIAGNRLHQSVFVFTGVDPKAGTSFLAVNTAAALARSGARVLLVDARVEDPAVISMLGLSDQARFDMTTNSFAEGKGIEAFSSRLPTLYAMSLEAPNKQNPEYLLSTHLGTFIQRVKEQFDAVVIDAPPLSVSTAALGLSRLADEMVVAVKAGMTHANRLAEAIEDIRSTSGTHAKVVLNGNGSQKVPAGAGKSGAPRK